jgi:hypothetical protein
MKKLVLIFLSGTISFAVPAQNTDTKNTQSKKEASQKAVKSEPVAVLDGKTYKITLTQKDESMTSSENNAAKTSDAIKDSPDPKNIGQTKEPVENPRLNQTQIPNEQGYADWSNAKGKLRFDNGMIKLSLSDRELAMENCRYNVTSGTTDLATFSAGCKMNSTEAMTDNPVPADSRANTPQITDEEKSVAEQEMPHPDDRVAINKQPGTRSSEQTINSPEMDQAKQDKEIKSSENKPATLNITGFVNGSAINGSIVVYDNGKMHSYSFSGSSTGKRDTEPLGIK